MSRKTSRSKRKSVKADCTSSTSKRTALKDKLAAELAGFADFNKPPVPLSHRYHASAEVDSKSSEIRRAPKNAIKADRQSRSQKSSKRIHRVEKSRIIKPNMKAERINRRNLKAEVEQLEPWHDWVQELKRNPVAEEEDDDDDDDESPKCHRRNYPPRQKGVQNVPWSALSGEIRNMIYQQVMENDEKVRPTLTHYPNGIPRRTTRGFGDGASENFPQSSWGFTQTTRQIREELTPWLLDTRRVRTRLSTVNEYVDTFQRRDGKPRLGWIEPFCCGMPLPAEGVEVLNLIENHHRSSKFYLQLESTPTQLSMLELHEVNDGQEMWLLRSLSENYHLYANDSLRRSAVRGIRIAPYMKSYGRSPKENPDDEGISDRMSADGFLVKLDIQQVALQGKNEMELSDFVESIEDFIETSGLGLEHGLRIQARLGKYVASWHIDRKGLMHSSWCRMRR
ncbi:hypothetical protein T440DRAFT_458879 [Plenodomus tracheiphilus IPT5]|uniref:Uncharacterized protein n=1 Tax=Plenodomus tracheiphilus IPT5 TaxID=1408161 RepID=A0A6A7ASJ3_9PLEO|nr:hypothetical protein T440DRAFT_458879 [Plenodomus tracheiphilus IPT5]